MANTVSSVPNGDVGFIDWLDATLVTANYGRGGEVGRGLGDGASLGVGVGLAVDVGVAVAVEVGVTVAVAVGVGDPPPLTLPITPIEKSLG